MALRNIFNEPRRELTEQGLGLLVCACVLVPWVGFGWLLAPYLNPDASFSVRLFGGMLITALGFAGLVVVLAFVHMIGEEVCEALARHGLELRPERLRRR